MSVRYKFMQSATGVIATFCLILFSASFVHSSPRLTLYEDAFNFGYIPRYIAVSHDFWLFSTGDEPLLVLQVVPGCSCTQMPLEKKMIPVGDSSRLEIVFHSRTFTRGLTKRPTVLTNASPDPQVLQVISYVLTNPDSSYPIQIQPWDIQIDASPDSLEPEKKFVLKNLTNELLDITVIDEPKEYVEVIFPEGIAAKGFGTGVIRVKPGQLKKSFEKSVTFELNDKDKSRFTIPIKRTYKASGSATLEDTLKQVFDLDKK